MKIQEINGVLKTVLPNAMINRLIEVTLEHELPFNIKVLNEKWSHESADGVQTKYRSVEIETEEKERQYAIDTLTVLEISMRAKI